MSMKELDSLIDDEKLQISDNEAAKDMLSPLNVDSQLLEERDVIFQSPRQSKQQQTTSNKAQTVVEAPKISELQCNEIAIKLEVSYILDTLMSILQFQLKYELLPQRQGQMFMKLCKLELDQAPSEIRAEQSSLMT
jgi:hypothetical protein